MTDANFACSTSSTSSQALTRVQGAVGEPQIQAQGLGLSVALARYGRDRPEPRDRGATDRAPSHERGQPPTEIEKARKAFVKGSDGPGRL